MTTEELNTIVEAVVAELEKNGVDFDYKAEQAKDDDLVFVIRGTAPDYQGVTVTWKGLLDIITAQATQAKNDAETAKNAANTILEQVQSKGTEITNFVATSKTEIETQKNESVNAVKSVYQSDLNELKGDLGDLQDKVSYKEINDINGYISVPFHFDSGKKYIVEQMEGQSRLWTRATESGQNIDTIKSTYENGYFKTEFIASADAEYLRMACDSVTSVRITVDGSSYIMVIENAENIIELTEQVSDLTGQVAEASSEIEKLGRTIGKSYELSDFTPDTYYAIPNIDETISPTPSKSGVGNKSIKIKVLKDEKYEIIAETYDGKNTFGFSDNDYVIKSKQDSCKDGYSFTAPSDGYIFVSTIEYNFMKLTLISSININLDFNGFYRDIYAPYPQLSADNSETSDFDSDNITSQDIYNAFDELVSKYPHMIEKEYMGKDATNTYPIYRYVITQKTFFTWENKSTKTFAMSSSKEIGSNVTSRYGALIGKITSFDGFSMTDSEGNEYIRTPLNDTSYYKRLGTIFIGANEHGPTSDPRECAIIVTRLARDLCYGNAKTNDYLNILKKHFRFVIIPVQNPYGFDNNTRNNGNNVNINRNYATQGWANQTDTDKGASAGSEVETQYIMNTISACSPIVALDLHCLGNVNPLNDNKCHYAGHYDSEDKLTEIVKSMFRDYELECSSYGNGDFTTEGNGDAYFNQLGIKGLLLEFNSRDGKTSDGVLHTSRIMEANYTFMLRILNMLISDYNSDWDFSKFN